MPVPPGNEPMTHFKNRSKVTKPGRARKDTGGRSDDRTNIFGAGAPSRHLRPMQAGNILATELIAFLPNSLRSHDTVRRFTENGGSAGLYANIVNFFRPAHKDRPIMANSVHKMLCFMMREHGLND